VQFKTVTFLTLPLAARAQRKTTLTGSTHDSSSSLGFIRGFLAGLRERSAFDDLRLGLGFAFGF
jgi:hypothetical protein